MHTGVDKDGFIHRQTVTLGNVHDSRERDRFLLGDEAVLYADAAYSSRATRDKQARLGIADRVQRKGYRNHPLSAADKRCYGLGRTRFLGLAKNTTVYGLAAIAHNIRKGARFLGLYGVAEPACGKYRGKCARTAARRPSTAAWIAKSTHRRCIEAQSSTQIRFPQQNSRNQNLMQRSQSGLYISDDAEGYGFEASVRMPHFLVLSAMRTNIKRTHGSGNDLRLRFRYKWRQVHAGLRRRATGHEKKFPAPARPAEHSGSGDAFA